MKHKISITQMLRHIIQLGAFLLLPELFITLFSAIRTLYRLIITDSFQLSACADQLLLIAGIFLITLLAGRFFCGYICSFGAMGDLLYGISSKIIKKPIRISAKTDRALKWIKYILLFISAVFLWGLNISLDSSCNPWHIFGIYSTLKGWSDMSAWLSVGGVLLGLILVGDFLIERFFCRYICPLGAVFALISQFRPYRLQRSADHCGSCKLCTGKCSMGIALNTMEQVDSGECINCYRCVDVCPRENITAKPTPLIAGTLATLVTTGFYFASVLCTPAGAENTLIVGENVPVVKNDAPVRNEDTPVVKNDAPVVKDDGQGYRDGVYTGVGTGFRGKISVEVTVENGTITNITVLSSSDDRKFSKRAIKGILPNIISQQSVDVDTVSGATFSSNGILEAVADALKEATL